MKDILEINETIVVPGMSDIEVMVALEEHIPYANMICDLIDAAAKKRGTGIAKRTPEQLESKIRDRKAVIALCNGEVAGFVYLESWEEDKFVSNSGLIVNPEFRRLGVATIMKRVVFNLSRKRFPDAKIFGITTSLPVMKINTELGYKPVTFSELTQDDAFWRGCEGCRNFDILTRTARSKCLCTGLMYAPSTEEE